MIILIGSFIASDAPFLLAGEAIAVRTG
jgi:hypothetical protein